MAGEEVITTGAQLAEHLDAALTLGPPQVTLTSAKGTTVYVRDAWHCTVSCVFWAADRSVRTVKRQQVPIIERLPVAEARLTAYLDAVGALLEESAVETLEHCEPDDFFAPRLLGSPALVTFDDFLGALRRGFGPLTWAQGYEAEVLGGGHLQYFASTASRFWPDLLPVLDATRAKLLREAVAVFGELGPARELETRRAQLRSFSAEQRRALEVLDRRYAATKK